MVHHVTVQHEDAGVVEEAGAEGEGAALAFDDGGVAPLRHGERLAVEVRHQERIGMDVERVVVVLVLVHERPFLDGAQLHAMVDAARIELLAVDQESELAPVAGCVVLG